MPSSRSRASSASTSAGVAKFGWASLPWYPVLTTTSRLSCSWAIAMAWSTAAIPSGVGM